MNAEFFRLWRQTFEITTGAKTLLTLELKKGVRVIYWHNRGLHTFFVKKYGA